MEGIIKIVLAVLFFLCLLDWPYEYFQFVRFIAMVGFGILAYMAWENENRKLTLIYIFLGILFQPIIKIVLGRELWNIVDVLVGVALLASLVFPETKQQETNTD